MVRAAGGVAVFAHPLARRRRVRMVELHHVRMVLLPAEFKLSRSLKKTIRRFAATPGGDRPVLVLTRHEQPAARGQVTATVTVAVEPPGASV